MKILFTRFPLESSYGGAEVQTISLMKGLMKRGHAVAFVGSCPTLLKLSKEYRISNAEYRIGKPPVTKWAALTFYWRQRMMLHKLKAILNEFENLDAIMMLSLSEKILLTPYALKRGIKLFWIEHDKVGPWLTMNPWRLVLKALSKKVTTVCVSDLSADLYKKMGFENVVAIPNGISREVGPQLRGSGSRRNREVGNRKSDLCIGCIARLSYEKGVDLLIKAVKEIPDVRLEILGKGKDEAKLRDQSERLNQKIKTSKPVTFSTYVENINDFYNRIDLLVLPSREHDPFGLVAAEAIMRGIPVIVTDQCGISRHIEAEKDALVVKANSIEALKEAIITLQDDERRREIAAAGKKAAEEKFTLEKMIDEYEKLAG